MNQVIAEEVFVSIGASEDDVAPSVASLPPRPEVFSTAQRQQGRYTTYTIDTEYPTDAGIRVLPTSGGDGAAVRVRVHMGITEKIVRWTAERWNAKPVLPGPNTGDPNDVLINAMVYPANVYQLYNATLHRVSGVYTYRLLKPKMPADQGSKYPIGTTPAEIAASATRFYDYHDFSNTILDASAIKDLGGRANMDIPLRTVPRQGG